MAPLPIPRTRVRYCLFGREGVFESKGDHQAFEPSLCLGPIDDELKPPTVEAITLYVHRVGENRFMLYAVEDEDLPLGHVFGIGTSWISIPSELALAALFTESTTMRSAPYSRCTA